MELNYFENLLEEKIHKILIEKMNEGIEISEDELNKLIQNIYSVESINEQSEPIFQNLLNNAPQMVEEERLISKEFEARLQLRWLEPLYYLSAIIKISEEVGIEILEDYLDKNVSSQKGDYEVEETFDVLLKIYGKAIVTGKEINTLLKSGFSDGAMSRWRSLHEYNIYLQNLLKNKDDKSFTEILIKKYKDYSIVERYKEVYKYHKKDKNFEITDDDYINIKKSYKEICELNGKDFNKPYAWAKSIFPNKSKIFFSDLEKNVGIDHLAIYYQQANYQIHASPTGVFNSLGDLKIDGQSQYGVIFGPSNYGLSIPGQLTAISLTQLAISLLLLEPNPDRHIRASILQKFVNIIKEKFDEVQTEIENQELQSKKED